MSPVKVLFLYKLLSDAAYNTIKHTAVSDIDVADSSVGPGLSVAAIMPYGDCLDRP